MTFLQLPLLPLSHIVYDHLAEAALTSGVYKAEKPCDKWSSEGYTGHESDGRQTPRSLRSRGR